MGFRAVFFCMVSSWVDRRYSLWDDSILPVHVHVANPRESRGKPRGKLLTFFPAKAFFPFLPAFPLYRLLQPLLADWTELGWSWAD